MAEKPFDYEMCRKLGRDIIKSDDGVKQTYSDDLFTVIVAYYDSYQLQLWVDENNTKNCWTLVVKND